MKGLYLPFVFLLFLILPNQLTGQNLSLKVLSDSQKDLAVIDSVGYKSKFKDYKSLDKEINSLRTRLTKIGYIDTKLITVDKKNDTLYETRFKLGKKVNRIRVYFDSTFNTDLLKIIDHVNGTNYFEIDINNLETDLTTLNAAIAEKGDPFTSLQLENILKLGSDLISASLRIDTSQLRRIDNIVIKGYENFPKSYIKYFLKLKEGETFGLNEIKKKVELLEDLRFANKIKDPEVLFTKDSTTLYLYVEKVRTNNFDGFLGFGTNETTNKLEFDGYLDLRLVNNLNYGETLNLYYKSDEIDQQTFRVNVDLPFLFKTPIGLDLGLNIFRKDSTFINVTQRANFNYQINALHKIGIGINAIKSSNLLEEDTSVLNDYSSNYFTANYNFNKPQFRDPLFPFNFWLDFSSDFGSRSNDLGDRDQSFYRIDTYKIFNLNNRNSIFTRINGAMLISDDYLDNELFRFGGINSIRGFEENSLVANLFGVINTEYRYRLSNTIYVHSVLDAAYFENDLTESKEKLFGFGFGLGLLTNAGLFRLNYSSGKSENRQFKLSDSKVHISLTATF
ncbi:POTRA domain-containing protein [Winogradskyella poriferorum]|uniref:POTRA domain-containing protein n=1 Tax=Winogradskyella poriferorum TaxID=307627 RepID=UPI003D651657